MKPKTAAAAWTAAGLLTMGGLAGAVTLGAGAASADTGPACPAAVVSGATATVTCPYTGGSQYWTVPDGITSATFTLYGAAGGSFPDSAPAGLGAEVTGTLAVTPGQVLQVNAGQAGAVNGPATFGGGGGTGGSNNDAGAGGGASDVRVPAADASYPLTSRMLVAGGGGGGGANGDGAPGGAGGNAAAPGQAGANALGSACGELLIGGGGGDAGAPAGDTAAGAGGVSSPACTDAVAGSDGGSGALGQGGGGGAIEGPPVPDENGDGGSHPTAGGGGGGGGGGWNGGGGGGGRAFESDVFGAGGGGGGGSSFTGPGVTGVSVTDGVTSPDDGADGEVVITWQLPQQAQAITGFTLPATAAAGTSAPLTAAGGGSGNPVTFTASGDGVCSVNGDVVDFTAAGTCVIDADQAGSDAYAAAPQVQQTVTVTAPPVTAAALTLADTAPASVHDGKRFAYTLTVTNAGGTAATGVTVTDVLPSTVQFEQATASQGAACSYSGKKKGGTLTCTTASLAAGATLTVTIGAHATSPGTVSDAAAVTADGVAAVTASAPVTVGN